jgi:IgA Peptidase M64
MRRHPLPAFLLVCLVLGNVTGCGDIGHDTPASGSAGTAEATVEADHAPLIDTQSTATVVGAGRHVQLSVGVSDPDGDRVTVKVSQIAAAVTLGNLKSDTRGVQFDTPKVDRATDVQLVLTATDASGLASETSLSVTVSPLSPSGKTFTVMGSPASDGLHWVITGDGFTADEQQQLLQSALAMAKEVTEAPELAGHAAVWNVHVLTAVSLKSGLAPGIPLRGSVTAFDSRLHCNDIERVACVNWGKVYDALLAERTAFDALAIILNTGEYVGSSSASGMVVSRNAHAGRIALHEMGHLVAGLGDEYVDASVARDSVAHYKEGLFPNITTATEPALIPWRHWFADPARIPVDPVETGIGHFEGAFYVQNGFFRPKHDSIMRTLDAPVGEVNAEAWLRALYRAVPPLTSATPARPAVTGFAGDSLAFDVVSPWPQETVQVRWWVDGMEIESARDSRRYVFATDGGAHEVRAQVQDRTGLIRDPRAREQAGEFTWSVSGKPAATNDKAARTIEKVGGWIRMHVDSTGHTVMGTSTAEARVPRRLGAFQDRELEYTLVGADGLVLSQGRLADPRVIRGPMGPPGETPSGHEPGLLGSGDYLIGIPAGAGARRLRIRTMDGAVEKAAPESKVGSPPIEQWLDL